MQGKTTSPGFTFFLLSFVAGCASFALLVWGFLIPDWRANNRYVAGTCVVLDRRLTDSIGKFPGEGDGATITYHPEIKIRYEVDGRNHEAWTYDGIAMFYPDKAQMQAIVDGFQVGASYPCWFDPRSPEKAILVRGHAWAPYFLLVVPVAFVTAGIVGMGHARRSRARLRTNAHGRWRPTPARRRLDADRPDVHFLKLSDSPGTALLFRLPTSTTPGRNALVGLLFALVWNCASVSALTSAIGGRLGWAWGKPTPWPMEIVFVLAALAGLAIMIYFIYFAVAELLVAIAVEPTTVEISRHPLAQGGHCAVFVSQGVRRTLTMNHLRVNCVCEQATTRGEGDDKTTRTSHLYDQEIFAREQFELRPGLPFEARATLRLPGDARPSFVTADEKVSWKLVVKGDIARWPDFERDFPFVVESGRVGRHQ